MNNLTYTEAITHIKKYKDFYCLKVIAERVNMNPCYFRNIINERYRQKDLPVKYRSDFVRVVSELCSVTQVDCDGSQYNTISKVVDLFYNSNGYEPELS